MFMYSKGPVSIRRALTAWVAGSVVRSETQLHTLPSSSGCIVRRKVTVLAPCSKISACAYSVKRLGQFATSLVISQTNSSGALITTELSVWAAIDFLLRVVEFLRLRDLEI